MWRTGRISVVCNAKNCVFVTDTNDGALGQDLSRVHSVKPKLVAHGKDLLKLQVSEDSSQRVLEIYAWVTVVQEMGQIVAADTSAIDMFLYVAT